MRPLTPTLVALVLALAGCGAPGDIRHRGGPVPQPSPAEASSPAYPPGFTPAAPPSPTPTPPASPTPFPETTTTPCGAKPTAAQIIALVKRETAIEPSKAIAGPLCAGDWHYTVLEVAGHDPVQVVTKAAVKLVAAGTEVCTVEVRLQAPQGIKTAAGC